MPDPTLVLFLLSIPCLIYAGWNRDHISSPLFVLMVASFILFGATATGTNHVLSGVCAAMMFGTAAGACFQIARRRPPNG